MSPDGQIRGQKQFKGILQSVDGVGMATAGPPTVPARFGLVLEGSEGAQELLEFSFDEVEKARLVPQFEFKSGAGNTGSKKR